MQTLTRELRKDLERTVRQARTVATAGAEKAIDRLGVGAAEPPAGLNPAARSLRNRLRAHGRQLGDRRTAKTQETTRLIAECAYEHWHRMLFARFLAENDLLIEPEHQVPISLDDCKELAREQKKDWLALASEYAVGMLSLSQIFRPGDPVLDVSLPPETRSELEDLLKALPRETFLAADSLGWVYQFWQADQKEAVNRSETKIGADELPAVTQLFTEDYMVLFLLHNTLGAWWAGRKGVRGQGSGVSEESLRKEVALPGIEWEYLRFIPVSRDPESSEGSAVDWTPASGTFPGWPTAAKEITLLDPCMGSGHFLVFALPILVAMRMAEEGLSKEAAVAAVLSDNLFGLELDPRCTQIAAFNLALAAWKLAGYQNLPTLNLACSGLGPSASEEEWLKLADRKPMSNRTKALAGDLIQDNLRHLHKTFSMAPTLGSLIDPRQGNAGMYSVDFETLRPYLQAAMSGEADEEAQERAVAAQGMVKAAELLASEYTLVITNVPYLGRGKQADPLKEHLENYFPAGKADLATAMVLRCLEFCAAGGSTALVTPQNWLFLTSYAALRKMLLKDREWNLVARLGPGAFETIGGHVVNVSLLAITAAKAAEGHRMAGVDVSAEKQPDEKAASLRSNSHTAIVLLKQAEQLKNPNTRVLLLELGQVEKLSQYAVVSEGLHTGDYPRFGRKHWEVVGFQDGWSRQQGGGDDDDGGGGCEHIIFWEEGAGQLIDFVKERLDSDVVTMWIKGQEVWGKSGIAVGTMSDLKHSRYHGALFTHGIVAIVSLQEVNAAAILAYIESPIFRQSVRQLDQKVCVARAAFENVPFDLPHWQQVASEKYPNGLPEPESDDPTQWLFHGRPEESTAPLQVAVARLLGYRWPTEHDSEMRLSQRARDLVARCQELDSHIDDDGIVCLTPVKGEAPAAERLNALLAAAYGPRWNAGQLSTLLAATGYDDLGEWLRDGYFEQHSALFHNRPFIWHLWDGREDGFHALVNYHTLAGPNGRRTLESLIYTYLGDWIDRQRGDQKAGLEGADARLASAEHLRKELEKILAGEPPYDIFVRWKPLHQQPIGWEPDINDGVRLNIRPFMIARPLGAKAKTACVLRTTPKGIKWDKDRGKEPQRAKADFPWFWSWDEETQDFPGGKTFDGNRWNGLHYSNAVKNAAREKRS